jgi:lipopolysaccharide export system ATP-binding protein
MHLGQCQTGAPPELSAMSQASTADSPLIDGTDALGAERLTVMRNGAAIIKDTSLAVSPGDILGVIGPNGCGKSTLLLALYGDPTCKYSEGRVLDGNDELTPQSVDLRIRRGIHLLPQEGGTFKSMTVAETLQASVESCCRDHTNPDRIKDIAWRVPHVERIWKRRCGALSGGERRLVGLARILILSPRYALLDEPSTGLDEKSQKAIAGLILELASKGVGVALAEQTTSSLRSICNREVHLQSRLR